VKLFFFFKSSASCGLEVKRGTKEGGVERVS